MTARSNAIIEGLLTREGWEYTNDPSDSGGPTKFGITLTTLQRVRGTRVTAEDVKTLTVDEARRIYEHLYIHEPGFDVIMEISPSIAEELIDTGVNCGTSRATIMLQRALNALNDQRRLYPDVKVDGACGPATVAALKAYLLKRKAEGAMVLLRVLNGLQVELYTELVERRQKDERFFYGWILNRVVI